MSRSLEVEVEADGRPQARDRPLGDDLPVEVDLTGLMAEEGVAERVTSRREPGVEGPGEGGGGQHVPVAADDDGLV